jgi:hypothetical protein
VLPYPFPSSAAAVSCEEKFTPLLLCREDSRSSAAAVPEQAVKQGHVDRGAVADHN